MFGIDPFIFTLCFGPLAVYMLLIGTLHLLPRPLVTTGAQDTAALAIGVSGLLMAGPLQLFFPSTAYGMLGWIVWVMLAVFFFLTVLLVILTMRPRLVVYGATPEQVLQPLLRAAQSLDPGATLEGQQVWCPKVATGVRVEAFTPADVPQVVPQTHAMSPVFWRRLAQALRHELAESENQSQARGAFLVVLAIGGLGMVGLIVFGQPQEVVAGFREWLRL